MIYTLEYLEKEANLIAGYWNGHGDRFTDGNGEVRDEEDADMAIELLRKIEEIKVLIKDLEI